MQKLPGKRTDNRVKPIGKVPGTQYIKTHEKKKKMKKVQNKYMVTECENQ